jgi:hypothetical protein
MDIKECISAGFVSCISILIQLILPLNWYSRSQLTMSPTESLKSSERVPHEKPIQEPEELEKSTPDNEYEDAEKNFQPKSPKFWAIMLGVYLSIFLVALVCTIRLSCMHADRTSGPNNHRHGDSSHHKQIRLCCRHWMVRICLHAPRCSLQSHFWSDLQAVLDEMGLSCINIDL